MRPSIKIIKAKCANDSKDAPIVEVEKSIEQNTREMVSTVKSWITELQDRKRVERRSLSQLRELWETL